MKQDRKLYLGINLEMDPSVAIVENGAVLAFSEEERHLRIKHAQNHYPEKALKYCLKAAGCKLSDISSIAINWNLTAYNDGTMKAFYEGVRREFPVDAATAAWNDALLTASDHLASVAMLRKLLGKLVDSAIAVAGRHSMQQPPRRDYRPATIEDEERYFNDYAAYADAMVAAARRHGQDIAFFWEHWLGDLGDVKPLSEREQWLHAQVRRAPEQTDYATRMRDRWIRNFGERKIPYVDPIGVLRTNDQTLYIDYLHYTRRGNDVMARATYDALRPLIHAKVRERQRKPDSR